MFSNSDFRKLYHIKHKFVVMARKNKIKSDSSIMKMWKENNSEFEDQNYYSHTPVS